MPRVPQQISIPLRITVLNPPPGVRHRLQRGRFELQEPSRVDDHSISFDLEVRLGASSASVKLNFVGEFAQGTPQDRFIYVNTGMSAGQPDTDWQRRAKIKLAGISRVLLDKVLETPGWRLEARYEGTAKDGGPSCATVPLPGGWTVTKD